MTLLLYLDNNLVSAIIQDDQNDAEMDALIWLLEQRKAGMMQVVTSEVSRREIERLKGDTRRPVQMVYSLIDDVPFVEDHRLLGFHSQWGRLGGTVLPLIEDHPVSSKLRQIGLDRTDAHHVMLAILEECDFFLTCDKKTILAYRREVEAEFPIRFLRPSELVAEVRTSGPTN